VHAVAETQVLRAWSFKGVAAGTEAIRTLLQSELRPAVVRLYDEFDTVLALSGKTKANEPEASGLGALFSPKALAGELFGFFPSLKKEALSLLLRKPSVANKLAGVVSDTCLLVLMFEGPREGTAIEAAEAERLLSTLGGVDLGSAPAERWKAKRYAVSYRQSKVFAAGAFNDTAEVAATWDLLPRLYRDVKEAIGRHAFVMAHFSHAYPEGCSIYFTFAGFGADADESRRIYDAVWADLLQATHQAGGTISHHHGVGLSKARFLPDELGPGGMQALTHVKAAIDPERRFNPGKLGL
jgi:alkyldihydroxyacetonephosphate synthase